MIITSHMQNIIQIYPCLLKLWHKQESVTDRQTDRRTDSHYYYIPSPLSRGDNYIMAAILDQPRHFSSISDQKTFMQIVFPLKICIIGINLLKEK